MQISPLLNVIGLVFDLFGAVIVLASDWGPLYKRLTVIGEKDYVIGNIPIIGIPFRRLNELYRLQQAESQLLGEKLEKVNWTKDAPPLNEEKEGFEALKRLLVTELDALPQFNRVSIGHIQRGHTDKPKVGEFYLNTSILTVLENSRQRGIEPWYLRDYVDDVPLRKVEQIVDEKKSGIVVGIGARLLIVGFTIQLVAALLPS